MEKDNEDISITRQCELLNLSRSSFYYETAKENNYNLELMRKIDEIYTREPSYGSRRIAALLKRDGYSANRKRIKRLMNKMGIEAVYPKPKTTNPNKENNKYQYLLKNIKIDKPCLVWCSDITYIRLREGFIYLTVVMDWYSRYVISWSTSITLEAYFCIEALEKALLTSQPDIFNTDQGSQYTCSEFINILKQKEIRISMAGKGRCFDNIFVERLWRSLKYEEVYVKDYESVMEAQSQIGEYFLRYNNSRPHQSLGYRTPAEVHFSF